MSAIPKKHGKLYYTIRWTLRVLLILLLAFLLLFHRPIYSLGRAVLGTGLLEKDAEKLTYTEQTLTQEQMLADFDYLYQNCCTDSLVREQAERYLQLDYDALYQTYRTRIENCKDAYEFGVVMCSFMAKLPGLHGSVFPPTDDMSFSQGFPLGWECAFDGVREVNYAYWEQFRDRMFSYTQKSAVVRNYGGDYVFLDHSFGNEQIEGLAGGRLLSLNGEPIRTALRELDTVHPWAYDAELDCVRVVNLIFNDSIGKPYDAEIEMPDGSILHKTLYNSAEYNYAVQYRNSVYPQEESAGSSDSAEGVRKCYTIETDSSRKLVFVRNNSCDGTQSDQFYEDLTAALAEADAENIILDIRNNGGGSADFATKGLCRALFDKETGFVCYSRFPKTDITKLFLDNTFYLGLCGIKKEDLGEQVRYSEDFTAPGDAAKHYHIYVLISGVTFSSGDIFANIAAAEDNVTLLGENTGGEGLTGNPLSYYLPESKFAFTFTPGISEQNPDDNYVGVRPDIYCPNTWENNTLADKMTVDPEIGENAGKLEYRAAWDKPVAEALKLIDSGADQPS